MSHPVLGALRVLLSPGALLVREEDLAPYLIDWRRQTRGSALAVALPGSTEELSSVVRVCAGHRVAMVPQGGNTGLCAGATPGPGRPAVLIGLARMNRIRSVDGAANALIAEAGCLLAAVQNAALAAGRLFPLSMGSEGSCQIGGAVSTNAGGTAVLRYGNMRELVLGMEVVLSDGRVWDGLRTLRKDNTGYDLKQLFIGAEGTLGVVSAVALRLFPYPRERAQAWVALRDPQHAVALLGRLREFFDTRLTACELLNRAQVEMVLEHVPGTRCPVAGEPPWHLLVELSDPLSGAGLAQRLSDALGDALEDSLIEDAAVARSEADAQAFWRIRHGVSEAALAAGVSVTLDVALPLSAVPDFIADADAEVARHASGASILVVSHVGDGNVHYIVHHTHERWRALADQEATRAELMRRVHDIAISHRGSFSAEHGIGRKLRGELGRLKAPLEVELLRSLKSALDPGGLMNPGKLLPD